jgi:pyrroline-5-carboxylate reductase
MKVIFLGAGNMASAIVAGMIKNKSKVDCLVYSPSGISAQNLGEKFNLQHTSSIEECRGGDYYVFACKPQQLGDLAKSFGGIIPKNSCIITLMTSVSFESYRRHFGEAPIVRVMPNTPVSVCQGLTTLVFNKYCTDEAKLFSKNLFQMIGKVFVLEEENKMDLLTPFNGSGPGILFYLAQQLQLQLVDLGLTETESYEIITQVFLGSSQLMAEAQQEGQSSFETLKDQVTSRGGVTQAAIESMVKSGFNTILRESMQKAVERSIEITKASSAQ